MGKKRNWLKWGRIVVSYASLAQHKQECEVVPRGYGLAWRNFATASFTCYPIPLNFIFRWLRDAYFWLMSAGLPGYRERVEHKAFYQGRAQGNFQIELLLEQIEALQRRPQR